MSIILLTPPSLDVMPVTLDEVKANSVIEHTNDDILLDILMKSAVTFVEERTARDMMIRTYTFSFDRFPSNGFIKLPKNPVREIVSITYFDQTVSPNQVTIDSSVYGLDKGVRPNLVFLQHGQVWPIPSLKYNAVTVTFKTGYADDAVSPVLRTDIPSTLRGALLMIIDDSYRNRTWHDSQQLHVNEAVEMMLQQNRWY